MAKLIVFSGLPGTGKSTLSYALAEHTKTAIFTKDQIDRSLEKSVQVEGNVAYDILLDLAELNLTRGVSLILDAVFSSKSLQNHLVNISNSTNSTLLLVKCSCSDTNTWKSRIENRDEVVKGWTPADWNEVQRVQKYYHNWEVGGLELDAKNSFEDNFNQLLKYIENTINE